MIAFLDASALIYLIEGREPWSTAVKARLLELEAVNPSAAVALSRLSSLECRVQPLRDGDEHALALFDAFFSKADLLWVEL